MLTIFDMLEDKKRYLLHICMCVCTCLIDMLEDKRYLLHICVCVCTCLIHVHKIRNIIAVLVSPTRYVVVADLLPFVTHPIFPLSSASTSADCGSLLGGVIHTFNSWRIWAISCPAWIEFCSFPLTWVTGLGGTKVPWGSSCALDVLFLTSVVQ